MKRVLMTDRIHPIGHATLEARDDIDVIVAEDSSPETLARLIPGVHGIAVRTAILTEDLLALSDDLEVVSRHGVGCDNMSAVVVTFGTQAQAFPGGEHAERLKASGGAKVVGGSSGADGGGLPPLASALSMTRR